jgi:hypothetical protein
MNVQTLFDNMQSHALASGRFASVNTHEPKSAPGNHHAALWVQSAGPVQATSGLTSTSARVEFKLRVYANMLSEPQDAIDPEILTTVDELLTDYSGDFSLGAAVMKVDLLGAHGEPLGAQAGYINQDGQLLRVMDITIPLIVNDAWSQSA